MIKVLKKENEITITGHGKDIVCSAVSSIAYTSVNAILKINAKSIKVTDDGNEFKIKIKKHDEVTEILINNMLDLLKELSIEYSENVEVIYE